MGTTATAMSKISIGTTTAMANAVAYAGDTWTLISNVKDLGELGSEANVVVSKYVDRAFARKRKGSRDNGTLELKVDRDSADVGYIALLAAEKSSHSFNFQIELNDKPAAGASPKNSIFFFNALVASAKNAFNDADQVVETTFSLAINGEVIEVAASAS